MKLEKKHLIVVGIVLTVVFHVVIFLPVIPVEESYIKKIIVVDVDGDGREEVLYYDTQIYCLDGRDGSTKDILPSYYIPQDVGVIRTRTVYKSIIQLLSGSKSLLEGFK
jgi:hypothetical protein